MQIFVMGNGQIIEYHMLSTAENLCHYLLNYSIQNLEVHNFDKVAYNTALQNSCNYIIKDFL